MKSKSIRFRLFPLIAVSATCSLAQETWTGLGGNDLWSTGANWADNSAPSDTAGALTFSGINQIANENDINGLPLSLPLKVIQMAP
jgi:hypothetical protein